MKKPIGLREAVEVVSGRVYNQQRILDMTKKISKRGRYKASLKEEVAKQAIMGIKTVEQIASDFGVSPDLVRQWRNQAQEALTGAFRNRNTRERNLESQVEVLKSVVCKREMELEVAVKKSQGAGAVEARRQLLGKHPSISRARQCKLLGVPRSGSYYKRRPRPEPEGLRAALSELYRLRSVPWSAQAARHAGARLRHPRGGKARSARARRDGFAHHLPASRHEPPRGTARGAQALSAEEEASCKGG